MLGNLDNEVIFKTLQKYTKEHRQIWSKKTDFTRNHTLI